MPIDVKDAGGTVRTLPTPNNNGRTNAAGSRPVALSTEDLNALQNMLAALQGTLQTNDTLGAPITGSRAVTPSAAALSPVPRALYVGTGGTLVMRGIDDTAAVTWQNVPGGSMIPFRAQYILTDTTAAGILALY